MKLLVALSLLLIIATASAQQNSPRVDSLGTVDNMPVVKGRGNSANMPTQNSKGNAVDMPTVGVPAPLTSEPLGTTGSETGNYLKKRNGRFKTDSLDRTKSIRKHPLPKKKQDE